MALATLTIDINARMASIEKDMGRAAQIAERNAQRMERAFQKVADSIGLIGGVLSVGALASWVKSASDAAAEIGRLSFLSGTSAEEFQRYAAGAKVAGFEADKLADVLKDVNDKTGEYLATGGGPLKDFFEQIAPKIGLAAEAFRGLSGPQALQLYYDSLEKANVSQAQATFYMEALANDATALIPLLRDNGTEFKRIADEAEALGLILDDKLIRASKEFNENLDRLQGLSRSVAAEIGNAIIPALNDLAEEFLDARRAGLSFLEALAGIGTADPSKSAAQQADRVKKEIKSLREELEKPALLRSPIAALAGDGRIAQLEKELKYWELRAKSDFDEGFAGPPIPPAGGGGSGGRRSAAGVGGGGSSARRSGKSEAEKQYESVERQIKALNTQASTFGLSEKSATLYKLAMDGATEAQIKNAEVLLTEIDALEDRSEAQKRLADLLGNTQLEKQRKDMQLLAGAYLEGAISADEYGDAVGRALGNIEPVTDKVKDQFDDLKQAIEGWGRDSANAIVDFAVTGKSSFGDMIDSMLADLARMLVQQNVTGPLAQVVSGFDFAGMFGFASGGVMTSAGPLPLRAYASGGVANSPQLALYGEGSRPEAYVPLPDGRTIPVTMQGAGTVVKVDVHNNAGPDTRASATATTDATGNTQIVVMVEKIEGMMGRRIGQGGGLAPMLEGRYGLNPAAGARR